MARPVHAVIIATAAFLAALMTIPLSSARAASAGGYGMEILVGGRPLTEYYHGGKTYIEALEGREYAIRLTNHTPSRVAVALSVDGLNSIDARHTSAYDARKWVLGPYESVVIRGWQTSSDTARRFYFTTESGSYGAWLGRTRDLGNITAAFFPESVPVAPYYPYYEYDAAASRAGGGGPEMEKAAPAAPGLDSTAQASKARCAKGRTASPPTDDRFAATGIGRETGNSVYTVAFEHGRHPASVITVRYEFRDALVELGVLPRHWVPNPYYRRETSSGFADYGYAPDPYRVR